LTTEKDAQKLREFKELSSFPLYYLKVSVDFLWNKDKFEKKIKDYVESYS
jgi:tetraacyldisaccharide-1-P 4'-kinase